MKKALVAILLITSAFTLFAQQPIERVRPAESLDIVGPDSRGQESSQRARRGGPRHQSGGADGRLMGFIENDELARKFGISEMQRQIIRREIHKFSQEEIALRDALDRAAMVQARLLLADEVDRDELMRAVERTGAIHTELAKIKMRKILVLRETLTSEQMQNIRKYMEEKGKRFRERRPPMGQRREPRSRRPMGHNGEAPREGEVID